MEPAAACDDQPFSPVEIVQIQQHVTDSIADTITFLKSVKTGRHEQLSCLRSQTPDEPHTT
jgi:hypothetical protein